MSVSEHEKAAAQALARNHAKLAAAHSEAAKVLLADERRACDRVPSGAASELPKSNVVRVSVLERPIKGKSVVEGVALLIATGGRSFESVTQLVACRSARAAVTGDPADPFAVAGASVRVLRDDGDAAIVQIRSKDPARAVEIVRRARGLRPAQPVDEEPSLDREEPMPDWWRDTTR